MNKLSEGERGEKKKRKEQQIQIGLKLVEGKLKKIRGKEDYSYESYSYRSMQKSQQVRLYVACPILNAKE